MESKEKKKQNSVGLSGVKTKDEKATTQKVSKPIVQPIKSTKIPSPVEKILVHLDDEISFIIEKLEECKTDRVVVSIPGGSDLLVSSVGMKLIAQCADALKKDVVIVTDDTTGQKMAALANLVWTSSTDAVDENAWDSAQSSRELRKRLDKKPSKKSLPEKVEEHTSLAEQVNEPTVKPVEVPAYARALPVKEPYLPKKEKKTENPKSEKDLELKYIGEDDELEKKETKPMDLGRSRDFSPVTPIAAPVTPGITPTSIRKINADGLEMTIDSSPLDKKGHSSSAEQPVQEPDEPVSFVGKDFSSVAPSPKPNRQAESSNPRVQRSSGKFKVPDGIKNGLKNFGASLLAFFKKVFAGFKPGKKAVFKKFLIPLFVVLVGVVGFLYWFLPQVVVYINIESVHVSFNGEVNALTTANDVDITKLVIAAKMEQISKSGSGDGVATGVAYKGDKASGAINLYNKTDSEVTVPSGTLLSNGGLKFVLQTAVTVPKRPDPIGYGSAPGTVVAQSLGGEYNLASGTQFTIGTHPLSQMSATNPADFTGGSKTEEKVISQKDVDKVVEAIKKDKTEEAKSELTGLTNDGKWVLVESSIKSELDGKPTLDHAVGSSETQFNADVKTKTSALYYDKAQLDRLIETKLREGGNTDKDVKDMVLSDDIARDVSVTSTNLNDGKIVISAKVSGYVMPQMDSDEIARNLVGKNWSGAMGYLKQLDYVSGEPEVEFTPKWFPSFLWRMPSRGGRIIVNVRNVTPTNTGSSTEN